MALVAVASAVSVGAGYALGRAGAPPAPGPGEIASEAPELDDDLADPARTVDDGALRACEARLSAAEEALARRPAAVDRPAIDPASLPAETQAALASPEASAAIEAEVERRIAERFERERARRREEWAERRAEMRERLRAIGIDDATIGRVSPAMCAIRDVYRQAWQGRRGGGASGGGGDAGVRMGRRELRAATRELREEVETTLGPEVSARLEDEGGLRALGMAVECEGDER